MESRFGERDGERERGREIGEIGRKREKKERGREVGIERV